MSIKNWLRRTFWTLLNNFLRQQLTVFNNFCKKAASQKFKGALNVPLQVQLNFQQNHSKQSSIIFTGMVSLGLKVL